MLGESYVNRIKVLPYETCPETKDKIHLFEMFAGATLIIGLVITAILWWTGETFWGSISMGLLFALAGGLIGLVGEGLRTGNLGIRSGTVNRQGNPLFFWGCAVFYIIMALVIFYGFMAITVRAE